MNYARSLRKNMTEEERILWSQLRRYQQHYRFRRQYVIGGYIVDFVCLSKKLVVELDGSQHFDESGVDYDRQRTAVIERLGFKVVRFMNVDIRRDLVSVLKAIYFHLTGEY